MSHNAVQLTFVGIAGVGMFFLVFWLSRRQLLSLRYALGWMGVSILLVLAAIVLGLAGGISTSLPVSPTGLLSAVGLGFVLLITLQLSISLSGLAGGDQGAQRGQRLARGAAGASGRSGTASAFRRAITPVPN